MNPDFFKFLPSEIITNILLRLSVRSIAISKCVCKPWLDLLETDDFVNSHFAKSAPALAFKDSNLFKVSELEDELNLECHDGRYDPLTRFDFSRKAKIGGSANGLLFLYDLDRGNKSLYVCNPITREFCWLRCPRGDAYGFGVSKISGQNKVICIDIQGFDEQNERQFKCYAYTLGTGLWRRVEATDSFDWSIVTVGAFVNGNLHWMISSEPDLVERISCFDLETECFRSFNVPPLRKPKLSRRLYTLRDTLGFCDESPNGGGVVIWMMKEYGVENSWTMEYVFTLNLGLDLGRGVAEFECVHPVKVFRNGDVLMLVAGKIYMYDKITKTSQEIGCSFGAGNITSLLTTLTPSMISLERTCGGMENVISF